MTNDQSHSGGFRVRRCRYSVENAKGTEIVVTADILLASKFSNGRQGLLIPRVVLSAEILTRRQGRWAWAIELLANIGLTDHRERLPAPKRASIARCYNISWSPDDVDYEGLTAQQEAELNNCPIPIWISLSFVNRCCAA